MRKASGLDRVHGHREGVGLFVLLSLQTNELGEVLRQRVEFFVPSDDRLEVALEAFHHRVHQVLVVVCEQRRALLGLHFEVAAQRVEDELERTLALGRLLVRIHRQDVDALFDLFDCASLVGVFLVAGEGILLGVWIGDTFFESVNLI